MDKRKSRSGRVAVRATQNKKLSDIERRRQLFLKRLAVGSVAILIIGVLIWFLFQWAVSFYWSQTIKKQNLFTSEFMVTFPGEGIILRNEYLEVAPEAGVASLLVPEATLVEEGDSIVIIDNATSAESIAYRVYELEQKLLTYDTNQLFLLQGLDQQIADTENRIRQQTTLLRFAVENKEYADLKIIEEELQVLSEYYFNMMAEREQMPDDPAKIEDQISNLNQQLLRITNSVISLNDGWLSYWIDGAEGSYQLDSYPSLNVVSIKSVAAMNNLGYEREVKAGNPLFKVVSRGPWRWTGLLPSAEWQYPTDGLLHFLYDEEHSNDPDNVLTTKTRLTSWVVNTQLMGDYEEYMRVTVEFPEMRTSLLSKRSLELEYIARETSGLIVDKSWLIEEEGETGILVIINGLVSFQKVTIADRDGDRRLLTDNYGPYEVITNPSHNMIGLRLN